MFPDVSVLFLLSLFIYFSLSFGKETFSLFREREECFFGTWKGECEGGQ
jgi:hypothetical protein